MVVPSYFGFRPGAVSPICHPPLQHRLQAYWFPCRGAGFVCGTGQTFNMDGVPLVRYISLGRWYCYDSKVAIVVEGLVRHYTSYVRGISRCTSPGFTVLVQASCVGVLSGCFHVEPRDVHPLHGTFIAICGCSWRLVRRAASLPSMVFYTTGCHAPHNTPCNCRHSLHRRGWYSYRKRQPLQSRIFEIPHQ